MERIDVEKQDMIRVAAGVKWGPRVLCVEQGGGGGQRLLCLGKMSSGASTGGRAGRSNLAPQVLKQPLPTVTFVSL